MLTGGRAQAIMRAMGSSYKYRWNFPRSPAAHLLLRGPVPNRPWTSTRPWSGGWEPLLYKIMSFPSNFLSLALIYFFLYSIFTTGMLHAYLAFAWITRMSVPCLYILYLLCHHSLKEYLAHTRCSNLWLLHPTQQLITLRSVMSSTIPSYPSQT